MSGSHAVEVSGGRMARAQAPAEVGRSEDAGRPSWAAGYGVALLSVAAATLLAFVAENVIGAPNLTLIFVLPVVICAAAFGWGPALAAVILGALAYDFFFTEPRYSLAIASLSDVWSTGLLFVVAAIVSSVAAEARRRAMEARLAADQAEALQSIAHLLIERRPQAEVLSAAAKALQRMFRAPAVVMTDTSGTLAVVASAGGAKLAPADAEAARWSVESQTHSRGESYPHDQSSFDFWPIMTASGGRGAVGVDFSRAQGGRPDKPEWRIDALTAYLARAMEQRPG